MAPSRIEDHFNIHRIPNGIGFLLFLLYSPIGALLLLIRILFCVQVTIVLSILPKGIFLRQWILKICGCVLGVFVSTDKKEESVADPKILVSNSISELDSLVLESVEPHMLASPSSSVPSIICNLMGYESFGNTSVDFTKNLSEFLHKTDNIFPALIFPEESTTNGKLSLLKFSTSYLQLCKVYQPIVLTAKRPQMLAVKLSVLDGSFWGDLLWTFFVPYTIFKVRYLPSMEKEESSSLEEFAKCIRKKMSDSLGLQESLFDASDKKEFVKRMQHIQPVFPAEIIESRPQPSVARSNLVALKNVKIEKMLRQVKDVLPQIPHDVIRRDLAKSKSVDSTLTNFLEGRVMYLPLTQDEIDAERKQLCDQETRANANAKKSSVGHGLASNTKGLSFEERKHIMIEESKMRYLEKHPEYAQ